MKKASLFALILAVGTALLVIAYAFLTIEPDVKPRVAATNNPCIPGERICTITLLNVGTVPVQTGAIVSIFRDASGDHIGNDQGPFKSPFVLPGEHTTAAVHLPPEWDLARTEFTFTAGGYAHRYPLEK